MLLLQAPLHLCLAQDPASGADQVSTGPPVTLEAQCPGVISDHAVFQQGIPVTIWGTSLPKATVKVRFAGQTKSTVSDDDGRWRVALDPMAADKLDSLREVPGGQPLTIDTELDGKKALKEFKDILVGEVWLCSGQSNMAGKVRHNHANQDPNDNLLESNFPAIRHISAPDGWRSAVPGSVGEFTRVGFCFARKVHREIKVPIGLVNACRGGSRIESWMRAPPKDLPESEAGKKKVAYGGLYRERIVPLIGYGMRGALWYQGEANASEGHSYFLKMESLIADWRASWKLGDFPFYFVQLAGIGRSPTDNPAMGDGRARIREAQRRALTIDNAGMAVAIDIGAEREHPANKVEVGERLAHWALHHDYGRKDILPSGPLYQGCEIEGKTIRISFDHAQGLMFASKEDYAPPVPTPEAKIPWLSIQAKDGTWHWAEGQIDDQDLIVSSKEVKEPVAVRYAYTNRPLGPYLYNKDGLPASPFTTEATHIKP
ncbi:MAG: sialate O-acetylesterase [Roseibacillus sp.]